MFDTGQFIIPLNAKKALLVSDNEWGLDELAGLLKTLGGEPTERMVLPQNRKIEAGTYVGKGKLDEIARILEARDLEMLLVDFDLTPSQLKNIEAATKKLVLDRSGIILEIFSRHARTKQSKLQVEIARLEYLMPRLTNLWNHFERQRGSGGAAFKGKGMGEKQIEVDRRLVKDRINALRRKLKEAESSHQLHRSHREALLKVAIVGYTNAGKSTLLNALTQSEVLVEDALFATLDATVRLLNPKSRPVILGIDTVGFIDRLPHSLVASFKTTLAAVLEADLILHVLDASDPEVQRHFDVTMGVLTELDAAKLPMMVVFNKCDRLQTTSQAIEGEVAQNSVAMLKIWAAHLVRKYQVDPPTFLSANSKTDVDALREKIIKHFEKDMDVYEVLIPFEDGKAAAQIYELGNVEAKRTTEKGIFFRVRTLPAFAHQMNLERYKI